MKKLHAKAAVLNRAARCPGAGEDNEVGIMFGFGYKSRHASEGTIIVTGSGGKNVIALNNAKLTIPDKSIVVSKKISF